MPKELIRCDWVRHAGIETQYHDQVWGVPEHDERNLFKMLILEGKQAGLSWITILNKQAAMEVAFDQFDPQKIILYDEKKIESLMQNADIIRSRLKINAVINNAKVYLKLVATHGGLDPFLWGYINHQPIINHWETIEQVPATTPLSEQISKDLKKLGFKFIGPTIVYAYMQAIGMVNDHLLSCFCRTEGKHSARTPHATGR